MATEKQKRARLRNWNKAQIRMIKATILLVHHSGVMYLEEGIQLSAILLNCETMLRNWEPKAPKD